MAFGQGQVVDCDSLVEESVDARLVGKPFCVRIFDDLIAPRDKNIEAPHVVDKPVPYRIHLADFRVGFRLLLFVYVYNSLRDQVLLVVLGALCQESLVLLPDVGCNRHLLRVVEQDPPCALLHLHAECVEMTDESIQVHDPRLHVVFERCRQVDHERGLGRHDLVAQLNGSVADVLARERQGSAALEH